MRRCEANRGIKVLSPYLTIQYTSIRFRGWVFQQTGGKRLEILILSGRYQYLLLASHFSCFVFVFLEKKNILEHRNPGIFEILRFTLFYLRREISSFPANQKKSVFMSNQSYCICIAIDEEVETNAVVRKRICRCKIFLPTIWRFSANKRQRKVKFLPFLCI